MLACFLRFACASFVSILFASQVAPRFLHRRSVACLRLGYWTSHWEVICRALELRGFGIRELTESINRRRLLNPRGESATAASESLSRLAFDLLAGFRIPELTDSGLLMTLRAGIST